MHYSLTVSELGHLSNCINYLVTITSLQRNQREILERNHAPKR